ncbi:MAG: DNA internalization-related competence protein ComEC/Rec2 [Lachnospiraceae bacterium]|nr:DNA internalization-related competence protein ComEC/Rec2 [Lachnospiraceae bacterium]
MFSAARKRPLCAGCLLLILFILLAKVLDLGIFGQPPENPLLSACVKEERRVQIIGRITDRNMKSRSVQYILSNSYLQSENQSIPLNTIIVTATTEDALAAGSVVLVSGKLSCPEQASNPGQFDQKLYYASQRIYYSLFLESCTVLEEGYSFKEALLQIRNHLLLKTEECAGEETEGILKAMLLGDRSGLSGDMKRGYQVGGILHILAISGMHISLLGQGILKLLQKLRLPFPLAAALSFTFLVLYCLLTGVAPSAVRAVCMFAVLLGARLLLRSYDALSALALAGILMLLENPAVLFASGFQLSFGAILAVTVIWPSASWLLPGQVRKPSALHRKAGQRSGQRWELTGRQISRWGYYYFRLFLRYAFFWFTISAAMLPLTAWYYYEIPLWGLLPNLLLIPLAPALMGLGTIGILTACLNEEAGQLLLLPLEYLLKAMHVLTDLIRSLPWATFVCGKPAVWQTILSAISLLTLACLLIRWKSIVGKSSGRQKRKLLVQYRKLAGLGVTLFLFVLLFRFEPVWSLTMLDVGQGDCLVIQNRSCAFLVDGGSSSVKEVGQYRIIPYLKSQGIQHLDGVFLTHPDEDHSNGILEIFRAVEEREVTLEIDRLYLPFWMEGGEEEKELVEAAGGTDTEICYLARGDSISAGITEMEVLNPLLTGGCHSGNSGSLVLSVSNGYFDALLTGDLESDGEQLLLPLAHSYEYLKTAHHGSKGSSSELFLQQVQPVVAAISAPAKSRYGHPHQETLLRLEAVGAEIYATIDCGAIRVEGNKRRWKLRGYLSTRRTSADT